MLLRALALALALTTPLAACHGTPTHEPSTGETERHTRIEAIAVALDDYVFEDVAATMQADLRKGLDEGRYAALDDEALAERLTADLRAISHDGHLAVRWSKEVLPTRPSDAEPSEAMLDEMREAARAQGYGIAAAERREGNIGYLDVRLFFPVEVARERIGEAMTSLADTDALIIDLRHNGGGDPATVAFMTSYLFDDAKVHLNDLYYRNTDETFEYWTDPAVPGKRFGAQKPVYVLTSDYTFSGGEEFANNLRVLGRATLIGERTGGGAHPVDMRRIDDHWFVVVPVGRAINPVTKTNWEGVGVEPHVEVPAEQALERALALLGRG